MSLLHSGADILLEGILIRRLNWLERRGRCICCGRRRGIPGLNLHSKQAPHRLTGSAVFLRAVTYRAAYPNWAAMHQTAVAQMRAMKSLGASQPSSGLLPSERALNLSAIVPRPYKATRDPIIIAGRFSPAAKQKSAEVHRTQSIDPPTYSLELSQYNVTLSRS